MKYLARSSRVFILRLLLIGGCSFGVVCVHGQGGRPDDAAPARNEKSSPSRSVREPRTTRTTRTNVPRGPKEPPKTTGSLNIIVVPADSLVELDNETPVADAASGLLSLKTIVAGRHSLLVRREGYREERRQIDVNPGQTLTLTVSLEVRKGVLSVRPNVDGSAIELRDVKRDQLVGSYAGAIDHIEFLPGEYEITISKPGYVTATRSISISGGASIEIEPRLDPLPPAKPPRPPARPMSGRVELDGKYLIVYLSGATQDDSVSFGSINVTASKNGSGFPDISGSLNGGPCRIEFFKMENVDDWSFIETPSPSNQYSRIVVRVRPKDAKRPLSFAVNWKLVTGSAPSSGESGSEEFGEAVPTHKVLPEVPAVARSSNIFGTVNVNVAIDEMGNVVSAKATDGPILLRPPAENAARRWKFRPATRNGKPTPTMQIIRFNFER